MGENEMTNDWEGVSGSELLPDRVLNEYEDARREAERRKREQSLADQGVSASWAVAEAKFHETVGEAWTGLVPRFLQAAASKGNPEMETFLVHRTDRQRPVGVLRGWVIGELPLSDYGYRDKNRLLVLLETGQLLRATSMDNTYGTSTCPHEPRWTYRASGEWAPLRASVRGTITGMSRRRLKVSGITPDSLKDGVAQGRRVVSLLRERIGGLSADYDLPVDVGVAAAESDNSRIPFMRFGWGGRISSNRKRLQGLLWIVGWVVGSSLLLLAASLFDSVSPYVNSTILNWMILSGMLAGPIALLAAGLPKHLKVKATAATPSHLVKPRGTNTSSNAPFFLAAWLIATDRRRR